MKPEFKSAATMLLTFVWIAIVFALAVAAVHSFDILTVRGALGVWFCLFSLVGFIGYFTARRGWWPMYIVINLMIILAIAYSIMTSKGDSFAPINFALVFLVAYAPVHLALTGFVGGLYWFFRRKKSVREPD